VNKHTKCFVEQLDENEKVLEMKIIGTSRRERRNVVTLGREML
jgi:hypothetical protein